MIKKILTTKLYAEFLSEKCEEARPCSELLATIVTNLQDTANCHKKTCAGLAANQIGYPYRVFAMKFGDEFIVIANPSFVSKSEKRILSIEGCLSIPGRKSKVMRHKSVKVAYYDPINEKQVTRKFKGFDAIVFQHEFDHGNGVLI